MFEKKDRKMANTQCSLDTLQQLLSNFHERINTLEHLGGMIPSNSFHVNKKGEKTLHIRDVPWKDDNCEICLESCEKASTICYLPCLHFFHCACLKQWTNNQISLTHTDSSIYSTCPVCRKKYTYPDITTVSEETASLSVPPIESTSFYTSLRQLKEHEYIGIQHNKGILWRLFNKDESNNKSLIIESRLHNIWVSCFAGHTLLFSSKLAYMKLEWMNILYTCIFQYQNKIYYEDKFKIVDFFASTCGALLTDDMEAFSFDVEFFYDRFQNYGLELSSDDDKTKYTIRDPFTYGRHVEIYKTTIDKENMLLITFHGPRILPDILVRVLTHNIVSEICFYVAGK